MQGKLRYCPNQRIPFLRWASVGYRWYVLAKNTQSLKQNHGINSDNSPSAIGFKACQGWPACLDPP